MRYGRSQPKVPAGEAGWNGWRRARSAWLRHDDGGGRRAIQDSQESLRALANRDRYESHDQLATRLADFIDASILLGG
jgi:hypothetical protein